MQNSQRLFILIVSSMVGACFQPGTSADLSEASSTGSSGSSTEPVPDGGAMSSDASQGYGGSSSGTGSTSDPAYEESSTAPASLSTGAAETGDDTTTGGAPCTGIGPAGLPGVNPNAIWIANSPQGTISKINTMTMVEEGRYLTRPDGAGFPSRTAVSLDGDVAVADRLGGLTKVFGDPSDCIDANRDGVVSTSAGSEFLPWPNEECRAWHLPLEYSSQRPVAWTTGVLDEERCEYVDEKIWTAGVIDGLLIEVLLIDGETGVIEESVQIPEIDPSAGTTFPFGFYGGAVDSENDFWVSMVHDGYMARFDHTSLDFEFWLQPIHAYGMTVAPSGHVFLCSGPHSQNEGVARFDPAMETWLVAPGANGSGCVVDGQDRLWLANDPMIAVDTATMAVVRSIDLPEYVHGVGVDFNGKVWGTGFSYGSVSAYRVDPETETVTIFFDLVAPYTYSDMTGFVLASVAQ